MDKQAVFEKFYRVERCGVLRLSDGGGPLGFDIHAALQIDYLIGRFECDAIFETGTFLGDTLVYLADRYQDMPVYSCEISKEYFLFSKQRVSVFSNVEISNECTTSMLSKHANKYRFPFFYLDAHWQDYWPLLDELNLIERGVICIDDFDIGNSRFGYDSYNNSKCNEDILRVTDKPIKNYFIGNHVAKYPFPCLQVGRRSGKCFIIKGGDPQKVESSWFIQKEL